MPQEIAPHQFDGAVAQGVVLVDFYTTTCGPCRQLAPVLSQFEQQVGGRVRIVKINVELPGGQKFGIRSVPTLVLFVDGREVDTRQGFQNANQLHAMVQPYVT